jgi:hypothetical protein
MLPAESWDLFKENVGKNLNFAIIEYEIDKFRKLLRDYPVINTQSNIIVYQPWSESS